MIGTVGYTVPTRSIPKKINPCWHYYLLSEKQKPGKLIMRMLFSQVAYISIWRDTYINVPVMSTFRLWLHWYIDYDKRRSMWVLYAWTCWVEPYLNNYCVVASSDRSVVRLHLGDADHGDHSYSINISIHSLVATENIKNPEYYNCL